MNSRRILLLSLVIVFMVTMLFSGCKGTTAEETTATGEETKATGEETTATAEETTTATQHKYAVIVHDVSSAFSAEFKRGAEDAGEIFGAQVDFMGTTGIDIPKQTAMFENATQGGYDGIAMTVFDQKAVERGLQMAEEKNIVITTFNVDGDWGSRTALGYAGANEFNNGKIIGEYMFKEILKGKGSYVLLPAIADLGVLIERMKGINEAAAAYPDIELLGTVVIGTDLSAAATAVENAITAYPDATLLFGTDHFSEAIANVFVAKNMQGKMFGAAFDITPGMLKAISLGDIQATMGQNPYLQGFYAVMNIWIYQEKGLPPNELDTGSELVTKDNLEATAEKYAIDLNE